MVVGQRVLRLALEGGVVDREIRHSLQCDELGGLRRFAREGNDLLSLRLRLLRDSLRLALGALADLPVRRTRPRLGHVRRHEVAVVRRRGVANHRLDLPSLRRFL